jgi:hypothetical protein
MTLVESTWSMLEFAKLSKSFWSEILFTWCYVKNGPFTSIVFGKTPCECWTNRKFVGYGGHDGVKGYHL